MDDKNSLSIVNDVLSGVESSFEDSVSRLCSFLRIPSISTDSAYASACREGAEWCRDILDEIGFDVGIYETAGHPMVMGHHRSNAALGSDVPHVLFYGHYDVQPADPLEKWDHPPFDPCRRVDSDGVERIYARGAADDKGQLMTFVEAIRAWGVVCDVMPVRMTVLFEGEEESGSPSLLPFLDKHSDVLRCDVALVCDTNMWNASTPAITTRLRGLVHEEVVVRGPSFDLHSGLYGGAAGNPLHVLSSLIASLRDESGRIMIPHFYDDVAELPDSVRAQWDGLDFSESDFLSDIGLEEGGGERDRSLLEQLWSRPTCEVNGIVGGYIGEGTKTVIPSRASAKFSFRLVADQDPKMIVTYFRRFIEDRLPAGFSAEFLAGEGDRGFEISVDNPWLQRAAGALGDEFGVPAVMMGCGASIPIVGSFRRKLGMDSLLVGFGLNNDRVHSPNEKYDLESFRRGIRSWARIIGSLGNGG